MPGIRLAATVAITYKAEDTMNDLPADEAAEAFRDSLQADLAQVYGDVEAIEVGDALATPPSVDPRLQLTVEDVRVAYAAVDDARNALLEWKVGDKKIPVAKFRAFPRPLRAEAERILGIYSDALSALQFVRDELEREERGAA